MIPKDKEIDILKIKIELIDKKGGVFLSDIKEVVADYFPVYRAGDVIPMDFLAYRKTGDIPKLKEARLSVQLIKKQNTSSNYTASPLKKLDWSYNKPANYDIEMRERLSSFSTSSYNNTLNHKLVLEFKNTGNTDIEKLQIETQWYDMQGKLLDSKTGYATISSYSKIKKGQTRIYQVFGALKDVKQIKEYKVSVVAVE